MKKTEMDRIAAAIRGAADACQKAIEGIDDKGFCNLDFVEVRFRGCRSSTYEAISVLARVNFGSPLYGYRSLMLNTGGQATRNAIGQKAAYDFLRANYPDMDVCMRYVAD